MSRGDKTASSEAAWALITEGVTSARLDAHRLRHLITRGLKLVETSPERDHLYRIAGDLIQAAPRRLQRLEVALDRTALALSKMGEDYLSSRLPLDDKTLVEEAVEPAGGFRKSRVERLARRWMAKVSTVPDVTVGKYMAFLDWSGPRDRIWYVYRDLDDLVGAVLFTRDTGVFEARAGDLDGHSVSELPVIGTAPSLKRALSHFARKRI